MMGGDIKTVTVMKIIPDMRYLPVPIIPQTLILILELVLGPDLGLGLVLEWD